MPVGIDYEKEHSVFTQIEKGIAVSSAVATNGNNSPELHFYAWVNLLDGTQVELFVNREDGLVVVTSIDEDLEVSSEDFRGYVSSTDH